MISEKRQDRGLSGIFNEHFINITKILDLYPGIISTTTSLPKIIEALRDHLSISKIFSLEGRSVSLGFIL